MDYYLFTYFYESEYVCNSSSLIEMMVFDRLNVLPESDEIVLAVFM